MSTSFQQNRRSYSTAGHLLSTRTTNFESLRVNQDHQKNRSACSPKIRKHNDDVKLDDFKNHFETDLTQKISQALHSSPQIGIPGEESVDLCHLLLDDVLAKGEFTVYQGADIYDFFAHETEPEQVSQVCLVNDHFMLVKMPESCWQRSSQIESIIEENETEDELQTAEIGKEPRSDVGKSAAKYFRCKRTCKISPIQQDLNGELEEVGNSMDSMGDSNGNTERAHTEVYTTITTISGQRAKSFHEKKAKLKDAKNEEENQTKDMQKKQTPNDQVAKTSTALTQTTLPRDNHYNSSMRESITLNPRGALVTPDITTLNGNIAAYYQHGADQLNRMDSKRNQLKTQGHFNAIRWLLRAFRSRSPKKPKSKIHAVIYKTYFVHWKKSSSSEDDRTDDSGLGLDEAEVLPKLRRSASF